MRKSVFLYIVLVFAAFLSNTGAQTLQFDTGEAEGINPSDDMELYGNHSIQLVMNDSKIDDSINLGSSYAIEDYSLNTGTGSKSGYIKYSEADPGDFSGLVVDDMKISSTFHIPEPATMLLFGIGLIGIAGLRSRLKK